MNTQLMLVLVIAAAIGSGIIAGIFFAFSTFIMGSFAKLSNAQGIAAMQSINVVILRSWFMPVFMGTAVLGLVLTGIGIWRWDPDVSYFLIGGGVSYMVGVFGVTAACNVPLNNKLDAVEAGSDDAAELWSHYLRVWTQWNHVRTVMSIVACVLLILAVR